MPQRDTSQTLPKNECVNRVRANDGTLPKNECVNRVRANDGYQPTWSLDKTKLPQGRISKKQVASTSAAPSAAQAGS